MKKLYSLLEKLYEKKVDATGLAIFRIAFYSVFLCEVIQIYYYRHLLFDKIPYLVPADVDFSSGLLAWMFAIVCVIIGFKTRTAALISYLFSIVFIATMKTYEYHMHYVYMGIGFLMIFLDSGKIYSVDRIIEKLKYSNSRYTYTPLKDVSVLNYYIPVLLGIGFVYFDSVFHKFASQIWLKGLGMWLPSSLPQTTHFDATSILNLKWLSIFLGYLTLAFELIFLFTFYRKKWRVPLLIIGIGLHVGIFLVYPIPWFGLGMICLYLLMIPFNFWWCIGRKIKLKNPRITVFYDEECPLCCRTKIIVSSIDFLNAVRFEGLQSSGFENKALKDIDRNDLLLNIYSLTPSGKIYKGIDTYRKIFLNIPVLLLPGLSLFIPGIYHAGRYFYNRIATNRYVERCTEENCGYTPPPVPKVNSDLIKVARNLTLGQLKTRSIYIGLAILFLLQLNVTYNSQLINDLKSKISFKDSVAEKIIQKFSYPIGKFSKRFLGITPHDVFTDGHFDGYNHIIGIQAEDKNTGELLWLPIIRESGHVGRYLYSFVWAKWSFRVNSPEVNQEVLENGIRDFTAFWSKKNNRHPEEFVFHVLVKKIDTPVKWEKDFLKKQKAKPWMDVGTAEWKENIFEINIPVIEEL